MSVYWVSLSPESCVPVDKKKQIPLICTATSLRTNYSLPFRRIAASDILTRRYEAAAIMSRDTIEKSDVCNVPLPIALYGA